MMACSSSDPPTYCSTSMPELKLYQSFIFSVLVLFTVILVLLFYLFYLRRRRSNWQSLWLRASHLTRENPRSPDSGIKKEVRDMLPVVVFKESFLIRETQCSVCLVEYQAEDRLQRIPPCGHTFHVDCIDHWLATNVTCPLCRVSLLPTTKNAIAPLEAEEIQEQSPEGLSDVSRMTEDEEMAVVVDVGAHVVGEGEPHMRP